MPCDALRFGTCKKEDAIMKVEKRPNWHLVRSAYFFSNTDSFAIPFLNSRRS